MQIVLDITKSEDGTEAKLSSVKGGWLSIPARMAIAQGVANIVATDEKIEVERAEMERAQIEKVN